MNYIRLLNYFLIIFIAVQILVLRDFARNNKVLDPTEAIIKSEDFFTFLGFGIKVTTYDPNPNNDPDNIDINEFETTAILPPNKEGDDILLLRTSQINQNPEFGEIGNLLYKNVFILCDEDWENSGFVCSKENFVSEDVTQNIQIGGKDDLNIGYIEKDGFRYFLFPEFVITNILRYPILLNLVLSISGSQRIDEIEISNNIEVGKRNGISFFGGAFISIFLLSLTIIYILNRINDKIDIKKHFIRELIPFISIIPAAVATRYALNSLPYVQLDTELTLNNLMGFDINTIPNSFWILATLLLLLIGSEFNIFLSQYKGKLAGLLYDRLNMDIVKLATIAVLSYSLLRLARNTEFVLPQAFLNSLIFSFFLFVIYINANVSVKNKNLNLVFRKRITKYLSPNTQNNLLKTIFLFILIMFSGFIYYYSQPKVYAKNKILFDPPKEYFITPYSKLIRPYEVYHEYNVETSDALFVDDFIISHPKYNKIDYIYHGTLDGNESFGYLEAEEKNSIKPLLNEQILKILEVKEPTSYFKILNKNDVESKVVISAKLKCNNEINSDVNMEKFRLSYDKKAVVYTRNALYRKRKCTNGEEYEVNIIMNLKDISTYSYDDEIIKLSSNNEIIETKILPEKTDIKIVYLDLRKEDTYVFFHSENSQKMLILTDKENANGMKFVKSNNQINLGENINLLRRNRLIPSVITIDSLNKYTLIKYIK